MLAWHFIQQDWRSGKGRRRPWEDGKLEIHKGPLVACKSGLHASPTPRDALPYAPGPLLSLVEIPDVGADCIAHGEPVNKYCARRRLRVKTIDISRELRLFACDVAEEALDREAQAGRVVDERSRAAIEVSRRFAAGLASPAELAAARVAAWAATKEAAWEAAWLARDAAWAATWDVAWEAASAFASTGEAQRAKFNAMIEPLFASV